MTRSRSLSERQEMDLIAAALEPSGAELVRFLETHPKARRHVRTSIERMRASFEKAYPGHTRTRRIPNKKWEEAGHPIIAKINRLIGLRGS